MRTALLVVLAFLVVLALWLGAVELVAVRFRAANTVQMKDVFDAVSSLFGALAFAGLLITIVLQKRELSLQRNELQLQREEMVASRDELHNQASAQKALAAATVAQIRVAAIAAEIESFKMAAEQYVPGGRGAFVINIQEASQRIMDLANQADLDDH